MLNFEEISGTIVIGAYFLLFLWASVLLLAGVDVVGRLRSVLGVSGGLSGAVGLAACFGVGMIAEDVSDRYTDSDDDRSSPVRRLLLGWQSLPTEEDLRFQALFKEDEDRRSERQERERKSKRESKNKREGRLEELVVKPKLLGIALARRGLFRRYVRSPKSIDLEQRIVDSQLEGRLLRVEGADREATLSAVSELYYVAKNAVVKNHESELLGIQRRIDFARSALLISWFLICLVVLLGAVHLVLALFLSGYWRGRPSGKLSRVPFRSVWPIGYLTVYPTVSCRRFLAVGVFRIVFLCLPLLLVYAGGQVAYESEELEFNQRAYGYFVTLSDDKLPSISYTGDVVSSLSTPDFSGMARFGNRYLSVSDKKNGRGPGARLWTIDANDKNGVAVSPVHVPGWGTGPGQPSDLEDLCPVLGREGEYLAVESGRHKGSFGRLMRLSVRTVGGVVVARVLESAELGDEVLGTDETTPKALQIEGLVGIANGDREVVVILGHRGAKEKVKEEVQLKEAKLTLGVLQNGRFEKRAEEAIPAELHPGYSRGCAALGTLPAIGGSLDLYAVASDDPDETDLGPFRSKVYPLARIELKGDVPKLVWPDPLELPWFLLPPRLSPLLPTWVIEGFKVESLAEPRGTDRGCAFIIGTDDEARGGTWARLGTK